MANILKKKNIEFFKLSNILIDENNALYNFRMAQTGESKEEVAEKRVRRLKRNNILLYAS